MKTLDTYTALDTYLEILRVVIAELDLLKGSNGSNEEIDEAIDTLKDAIDDLKREVADSAYEDCIRG